MEAETAPALPVPLQVCHQGQGWQHAPVGSCTLTSRATAWGSRRGRGSQRPAQLQPLGWSASLCKGPSGRMPRSSPASGSVGGAGGGNVVSCALDVLVL